MHSIMAGITEAVAGLERNVDLRHNTRYEHGTAETGWLAAIPRRGYREERGWARRVRYWLNSFRGFAAFDVRGTDDRTRR